MTYFVSRYDAHLSIVLPHEKLYLEHLPSANRYYKSFMHRDQINFVTMTKYVLSPTSHFCAHPSSEQTSSSQHPSTVTSNSGKSKKSLSSSSSTTVHRSVRSSASVRIPRERCLRPSAKRVKAGCLML